MITTRTKTTIKIVKPNGINMDATFGKGNSLADIICNLISYTGLKKDPDAIQQIKDELTKTN